MSALAFSVTRTNTIPPVGRWEARIFGTALALLLIHWVDASVRLDADPEVRALRVVLAMAGCGALAVALVRLGRVGRGTLSSFVGLVGLSSGATMHAGNIYLNGASGGDYTGLAYAFGGGLLLVLGIVTIERRISRTRYRLLSILPAIPIVMYVILPIVLTVFLTHTARRLALDSDLPIQHENVTLTTSDGLTIAGWYVPSTNGAAVVLMHGSSGNRTGTVKHIEMLARHGYGVLSIDARGHGHSTGDRILIGWGAEEDVRAAVSYLRARPDVDPGRIGGLGLSMGAEVMLNAQAVDDRLKAVVADGAGARTFEEEQLVARGITAWLNAPTTWLTMRGVTLVTGVPSATPIHELMPLIAPRSTLLISSEVEFEARINRLYHSAGPGSELWENPAAPHSDGLSTHPVEYEARVVGFFDRVLLGR